MVNIKPKYISNAKGIDKVKEFKWNERIVFEASEVVVLAISYVETRYNKHKLPTDVNKGSEGNRLFRYDAFYLFNDTTEYRYQGTLCVKRDWTILSYQQCKDCIYATLIHKNLHY